MKNLLLTPPYLSPVSALRRTAGKIRRDIRDVIRGETEKTFFDLHDLQKLNPILIEGGVNPLSLDPAEADVSIAGAKRFVMALLASNRSVRNRFPCALSDGPDGNFASWLSGPGASEFALTRAGIQNIQAAFASYPELGGQRIYEYREDLREAYPLGPCPSQRGEFLLWILRHGSHEDKLSVEDGMWWLFAVDERSDRGLLGLFASQPRWQRAVPHGATIFGWEELKAFLTREYKASGRWLRRASWRATMRPWDEITFLLRARPELARQFPWTAVRQGDVTSVLAWIDRQPGPIKPPASWRKELQADFADRIPTQSGVNVLAHFTYPSGLQEAAFGLVRDLQRSGERVAKRDLPVPCIRDAADPEAYQDPELFDTTLYIAATNTFPTKWYARTGLNPRPDIRKIACWYWELDRIPEDWVPELRWADEVWAATRFIASAFERCLSVPIVPMLPGLEIPPFQSRSKSYFSLPEDRFLFLFTFDMGSVMARKNPLGVVEAFHRAVRADDRAHLAIKVSRGSADPESLKQLTAACQQVNATLIDRVMTRQDALALLNVSDSYVSLHRSEGLGLGMAETMHLGKPVIATGYSGNLDFMTADSALLVDHHLVTIEAEGMPYPRGSQWAEPNIAQAAERMRWILDHREEAKELGQRAAKHIREVMSPEAASQRVRERLRVIRGSTDNR